MWEKYSIDVITEQEGRVESSGRNNLHFLGLGYEVQGIPKSNTDRWAAKDAKEYGDEPRTKPSCKDGKPRNI